jgi:hypothetical protein
LTTFALAVAGIAVAVARGDAALDDAAQGDAAQGDATLAAGVAGDCKPSSSAEVSDLVEGNIGM